MNSKPERFFYGWVVVAVMAVASAGGMAKGTLNFGLFVKPMGDDLGIGRASFGWAQTARWGAEALSSPIAGPLVDRFGSRVILPLAAMKSGLALIGLAHISHSWQLILLFAIMGLAGMSGPGALAISVSALKWFVVKRGHALAFMSLGIPIGALLFIPLNEYLIETVGWETAWITLAIVGMGHDCTAGGHIRPTTAGGHGAAPRRRHRSGLSGTWSRHARSGFGRDLLDSVRSCPHYDTLETCYRVQRRFAGYQHD
jgi:MFS family permease